MVDGQNIGSFGAPIGGGSALAEAMSRRGIDLSALQQTSPASAPGAPPLPTGAMPQGGDLATAQAAMPQEVPGAMPGAVPGATPEPESQSTNPELMSAIEALGGFVKSEGQTRREVVKARTQGLV
jgi:hypothetical protein